MAVKYRTAQSPANKTMPEPINHELCGYVSGTNIQICISPEGQIEIPQTSEDGRRYYQMFGRLGPDSTIELTIIPEVYYPRFEFSVEP